MNFLKQAILQLNQIPRFTEIRLELTNLCGCHCYMCPRDNIMTRNKGQMSANNLKIILDKLSYIDYPCQIHLHGSGEALLYKNLPEILKLIKQNNSNFIPLIITTLAYKLDAGWFESLFQNGLDIIHISLYAYNEEDYKIVHGSNNFNYVIENLKLLANFNKKYNIDIKINLDNFGENYPIKTSIAEHSKKRNEFYELLINMGFKDNNIIYRKLHNYGNSNENMPNAQKYIAPCTIATQGIRSKHLSIDWEGNVIPCCFDMNSTNIFGNIIKQDLKEIYNSKSRIQFIIKHLENKKIKLCQGCIEYDSHTQNNIEEYKNFINYKKKLWQFVKNIFK